MEGYTKTSLNIKDKIMKAIRHYCIDHKDVDQTKLVNEGLEKVIEERKIPIPGEYQNEQVRVTVEDP